MLVSPHRMKRPWGGQVEPSNDAEIPEYDSTNPLCPGNPRVEGKVSLLIYLMQFLINCNF